MMTNLIEPAVGEAWAYRARHQDPLVQVVVMTSGIKTPEARSA